MISDFLFLTASAIRISAERMAVIVILILASLCVAVCFLGAFIWAVLSGQFEDTCTPALRVLGEEGLPAAPRPGPPAANPNAPPT
jgi:cbb3-type cytochrome oxidase maturation protein